MTRRWWAIILLAVMAGLAAPAPGIAKACKCENFNALKSELAHAMRMRAAFAAKAAALRTKFGEKPRGQKGRDADKDYVDFKTGLTEAKPAAPGSGPTKKQATSEYVPLGLKLERENELAGGGDKVGIPAADKAGPDGYTRVPDLEARKRIEDELRKKGKDLCEPENGKAFVENVKSGAACDGISAAWLAHETAHIGTCRKMGYYAFNDRSSAELADDEVRGYDAEIKVLASEIQKVLADKKTKVTKKQAGPCPECYLGMEVRCGGYRVKGQNEALIIDEVVCDIEKPFTLRTTGESKLLYQMTPSGPGSGTYSYNGSCCDGAGLFTGSGTYTISLKDDGSGTLTMSDTQGTATVPGVGSHSTDVGVSTYNMSPEKCPDKQGSLERNLRGLAKQPDLGICRLATRKTCGKG